MIDDREMTYDFLLIQQNYAYYSVTNFMMILDEYHLYLI